MSTTTKRIRRDQWNTYACYGYTHCIHGGSQASAGGVHLHQVRRTKSGHWQTRVEQSNGRHSSFGPVIAIDADDGEAKFATAQNY